MSKKYDWKPKKKHKGLIIFLVIFSILVVLPVGFIFGAFFTTATKPVSDTEAHYENIVSESLYKGLDGLSKENPQIDFTIDEEMFDGIMMAACGKINQKSFIPKMYCYIDDNDYTFVVDLQLSFFKTRALLYTNLSSTGEGFDETLTFKIKGVTLGRLPIPLNWVTGIMGIFINDDMLNNAFQQSGFRIKSDLAHMQLSYNRLDFREDIYNYIINLGKENPYLDILLSMFGNDEVLKTDFKDGITASFLLDKLCLPELRTPLNFTELDKHRDKIIEWLDKGDTYLTEGNVYKMFAYLIRGYEYANEEIQTYIGDIKNNSRPIKEELERYINGETTSYSNRIDLNQYKGSKIGEGTKTFEEFCKLPDDGKELNTDFSYTTQPSATATFNIEIKSLNEYLIRRMDKAIGMTIPITYKDESDKWHFAYIVVDNLFVDFQEIGNDVIMNLYLILNISGVRVALELVTDGIKIVDTSDIEGEEKIGKLHFNLKEANFGFIPIEDISLLDDALTMIPSGGNNVFTYQKVDNKRSFYIDLDKVLPNELTPQRKRLIAQLIKDPAVKSLPDVAEGSFLISFSKQ